MMIYTSGVISDTSRQQSLEELQQNKLDLVLDKILIKNGDRMLDIGCGWGTLAVEAAKRGATCTGTSCRFFNQIIFKKQLHFIHLSHFHKL